MTTGAISFRVADFLKRFPPFSFFEEPGLLELARHGKVRFYEEGDLIYREGEPEGTRIGVIRQGAVRLMQQREDRAELVDMLGEGDLLGVGSFVGRIRHRATATALRDTIVYAFEMHAFRQIVGRSTQARRFLSAYLALAPGLAIDVDEVDSGRHSVIDWMEERALRWDHPRCCPLLCRPDTAMRQVAAEMHGAARDSAIVVDEKKRPLGIVTERDFLNCLAQIEAPLEAPVSRLMSSPVITSGPDFTLGSCLRQMMRHRCRHICITEDGTPNTSVISVVSENDLMLFYGNNPLVVLRELAHARSIPELAALRKRIDTLLIDGLRHPEMIDWCCQINGEAHRTLVSRLVQLARNAMTLPDPGLDFTFLFIGSAGRSELVTHSDLARALIYEDPSPEKDSAAEHYFTELSTKVHQGLEICGFTELFEMTSMNRRWRQPEHVWQHLFSAWIREPLNEEAYKALSFFDFSPVEHEHPLAESLRDFISREIRSNKRFLPLLANDAMRELPPVTLFEGDSVDERGRIEDRLRIKEQVTQPIVEIARIFTLHFDAPEVTNTLRRLQLAAERLPEERELFHSAAQAYRVGLYFRTVSGARHCNDGAVVDPAEFSRGDQVLIKNSFRTVAQFQTFAAKYFGLK